MGKETFTDRWMLWDATRREPRHVWVAALIGSAILLALLGTLEYRWNMQIRQATEIRLGEDLESVMLKWHLNLYREFSTICIALQVGPDSGAHDSWTDYLRRYENWRSTSDAGYFRNIYSNPYIVSDIYIYQTSMGKDSALLRLDADADKIKKVSKPPNLSPLLAHVLSRSTDLRTALHAWESHHDARSAAENESSSSASRNVRTNPITGWQFDESIPAIVHPILPHSSAGSSPARPVDWLIIVLNRDAITSRIFPELWQEYFESSRWSEYELTVMSAGQTSRLLYSSNPHFEVQNMSDPDSVMNIFGPPPESTEGSFWQVIKNRESLRGDEWRNFTAPVWFPVIQDGSDGARWILYLKRRTGPVEASVTRAWRANLLTGAFILLLLGTTMVLLIVAGRRAHTLAKMQMDFVGSISHELKTPLAAVLSASQNLTDGFAPDLGAYAALISAQARQLIELVDQILLFVAMKNGKKIYQLTPVPLKDIFENLRQTTLDFLERAGFHVECQMEDPLPCVMADKQGLLRCVRNLLENAAKYSGECRWIQFIIAFHHDVGDEPEIRISVVDCGIGIAEPELRHIFEPFYRSPAAKAAQISGSGLGLAVVKRIITEFGGRVLVQSEVGMGSTFTLCLHPAENKSAHSEVEKPGVLLTK